MFDRMIFWQFLKRNERNNSSSAEKSYIWKSAITGKSGLKFRKKFWVGKSINFGNFFIKNNKKPWKSHFKRKTAHKTVISNNNTKSAYVKWFILIRIFSLAWRYFTFALIYNLLRILKWLDYKTVWSNGFILNAFFSLVHFGSIFHCLVQQMATMFVLFAAACVFI